MRGITTRHSSPQGWGWARRPAGVLGAALTGVALLLAACGSGEEGTPEPATAPAASTAAAQPVTAADTQGDQALQQADAPRGDEPARLEASNARTVQVVERDFRIEPAEMRVQAGETIRLELMNEGSVLHDLSAEEFRGIVEAEAGENTGQPGGMAHMENAPVFHVAAEAGATAALLFQATEPGRYDVFCSVPGHRELGMTATLVVEG